MERITQLITTWNDNFPNYLLQAQDLKEPNTLMNALFLIFSRLGIDIEAVLAPPLEENCDKYVCYYWDLLPVINTTRVVNHLVSVMAEMNHSISITHILQPIIVTSHSILLMLINLMFYNENTLKDIEPDEKELFAKTDQVRILDEKRTKLIEMLNEQAEQKGKRSGRLEKLEFEKSRFEEDKEKVKEFLNEERKMWEALVKETKQNGILLEKNNNESKMHLAELAHWKALRVYDVNDVKAQVLQAATDVQEADEKLNSTTATLMEKESSVKNLQTIKPALDYACGELNEIMKMVESLKKNECDVEGESIGRSLEESGVERSKIRAAVEQARRKRAAFAAARDDAVPRRLQELNELASVLRGTEENEERNREHSEKAIQTIEEIKQLTLKYKEEKAAGKEQLLNMQTNFNNELKLVEEALINKTSEVEKKLRNKLKNCHNIKYL